MSRAKTATIRFNRIMRLLITSGFGALALSVSMFGFKPQRLEPFLPLVCSIVAIEFRFAPLRALVCQVEMSGVAAKLTFTAEFLESLDV